MRNKINNKLTERCVKCNKKLPKNSPHHWECYSCWKKKMKDRGYTEKRIKEIRNGKIHNIR